MPTLTVDDSVATELRRFGGGVELLDRRGETLGRFVPQADGDDAASRREWVARMAAEFPPDVLDRIEAEPTRTMADVLKLTEGGA